MVDASLFCRIALSEKRPMWGPDARAWGRGKSVLAERTHFFCNPLKKRNPMRKRPAPGRTWGESGKRHGAFGKTDPFSLQPIGLLRDACPNQTPEAACWPPGQGAATRRAGRRTTGRETGDSRCGQNRPNVAPTCRDVLEECLAEADLSSRRRTREAGVPGKCPLAGGADRPVRMSARRWTGQGGRGWAGRFYQEGIRGVGP